MEQSVFFPGMDYRGGGGKVPNSDFVSLGGMPLRRMCMFILGDLRVFNQYLL